jgi:hypothetical protein
MFKIVVVLTSRSSLQNSKVPLRLSPQTSTNCHPDRRDLLSSVAGEGLPSLKGLGPERISYPALTRWAKLFRLACARLVRARSIFVDERAQVVAVACGGNWAFCPGPFRHDSKSCPDTRLPPPALCRVTNLYQPAGAAFLLCQLCRNSDTAKAIRNSPMHRDPAYCPSQIGKTRIFEF